MSRVQPPGSARGSPASSPLAKLKPCSGFGHVAAVAGMKSSIVNGWFRKWLAYAMPFGVVLLQTLESGGVVRFTSSWNRHEYGTPFWSTCVTCDPVAFWGPFTPSQPPYRLSKLWFSS